MPCSTAPAARGRSSPMMTACVPTRPPSRSKASFRISSAAGRRPNSAWSREEIERFMSGTPCPACNGYRLKPEALAVKIGGMHIGQVTEKSIRHADAWFRDCRQDVQRKADRDRRRVSSRKSASACDSSTMSGSTIWRCRAIPERYPAAKASVSGWPRRSARA